jgi:hypothetical protein
LRGWPWGSSLGCISYLGCASFLPSLGYHNILINDHNQDPSSRPSVPPHMRPLSVLRQEDFVR